MELLKKEIDSFFPFPNRFSNSIQNLSPLKILVEHLSGTILVCNSRLAALLVIVLNYKGQAMEGFILKNIYFMECVITEDTPFTSL